jgi:hypothetical protein
MTRAEKEAALTRLAMPDGLTRMESGAVQFGEDWPGYYLRGKDAFALIWAARQAIDALKVSWGEDWLIATVKSALSSIDGMKACVMCDDKEEANP